MVDTHCHLDLFDDPFAAVSQCEKAGIVTIGMTNLPSHFELGYPHIQKCKKVRLSLGMHPLHIQQGSQEISTFKRNVLKTSYIGEVGLDFSSKGIATKELQISTFKTILGEIAGKKKLLSLHSRRAECEVFELISEFKIDAAIFHWYSGPLQLITKIYESGFYFSVNPAMIMSKAGQAVVNQIPKNRMLTESDGPFVTVNNRHSIPADVAIVLNYLSKIWHVDLEEAEKIVATNFRELISKLK